MSDARRSVDRIGYSRYNFIKALGHKRLVSTYLEKDMAVTMGKPMKSGQSQPYDASLHFCGSHRTGYIAVQSHSPAYCRKRFRALKADAFLQSRR